MEQLEEVDPSNGPERLKSSSPQPNLRLKEKRNSRTASIWRRGRNYLNELVPPPPSAVQASDAVIAKQRAMSDHSPPPPLRFRWQIV
jgi:hypothetical protein